MRRQPLSLLFVVAGLFGGTALAQTPALDAAAQKQGDSPVVKDALPAESPFPDDYDVIEAAKWRTVKLEMELSRGGRCDITLARPLPWLDLVRAKVGETVDLQMPEMGVAGPAKVIDLAIDGLDKPIGTTASHPFWSLDRKGWVAAGDLKPGEKLRTQDGSATVKSVAPRPGTETVYNLEVHKDHTFFVSDAKLWVHNTCILWRKSTGRTVPSNLTEKLAIEEAMSNPAAGRRILNEIHDPTWPEPGWVKMSNRNEHGVEIPWLWNEAMGAADDFKFK